jgi:hypothetical protein
MAAPTRWRSTPASHAPDIVVRQSGNDLIVGIRDPPHPNLPFTQLTDRITLRHWFDLNGTDRVEFLRFADGTTLNLSACSAPFTAAVPLSKVASKRLRSERSVSRADAARY